MATAAPPTPKITKKPISNADVPKPALETPTKPSLVGLTEAELKTLVAELGEKPFRAQQLHNWLYVRCARDFNAMTNLAASFRERLTANYRVGCLELVERQKSADGTRKYLFKTDSGKLIESVLMYFEERDTYSLCMSSQVGCAVDCQFCATGKLGFQQNLSVGEIVDQYLFVKADCRDVLSESGIRNIVFMGQGEPLLNYDNLLAAIRILNQSAEVGIRHITVSTSGIVPKINQLATEGLQLVLAVSLHAPDDETRDQFMPINRKWPVAKVMESIRNYVGTTGRRVTIEYILLKGINDTEDHAHKLGKLLQGVKVNVNLIPYNPIGASYGFERPDNIAITKFMDTVSSYGKKVTVRVERGVDIAAACGQLANKYTS